MLPLARNTISRTTSPSIFRVRPSAVYSGRGFSNMSTGVVAPSPLAAFFLGASVATVWSAKPVDCSVPRLVLGGGFAVLLPKPVLATVPRIPLSPPVPLPYPGPPGKAGEPRRLTFVALFGSPLPGTPFGSPKPPVCTLFTGATTVAGAALPVPRLPTFTSSFGRFGWFVGVSIFTCSNTGLSSTGFASKVFILGGATFAARKTCVCFGFSFTGSGFTGFGSGRATLGFTFGGGEGGGATGISVTGCINSTTRKLNAVCICCGKTRGSIRKKPIIANCPAALKPMRPHRGLESGSKARRAATGLVPIAFFHACGSPERPRFASKPTPIVVLPGALTIMVVIRVPPREIPAAEHGRSRNAWCSQVRQLNREVLYQYQSTDEAEEARIG